MNPSKFPNSLLKILKDDVCNLKYNDLKLVILEYTITRRAISIKYLTRN